MKATFLCGFLAGSLLFGGGAACAAGILAEAGTQRVFVDGREVRLGSYLIDGHNYLQLREVGEAVGFNVYWDEAGRTVQVESGSPYTGTAPERETGAAAVNPGVLTGPYTREAYDALRGAIATGTESEAVYMSEETRWAMEEAVCAVGCWPGYHIVSQGGDLYRFSPRYPEPYAEAEVYCRPFIDSLAGETEREQVRQMAFFVCDRIEYDGSTFCSPRTALISDSVQKGACMSYAHCFKFLCDLAGIPCVFVHSKNHQWNLVYVEGSWWSVDVTGADVSDPGLRPGIPVLKEETERQSGIYLQTQPGLTAIAKELRVPGSTG